MKDNEITVMISLIEEIYDRGLRNTPMKMRALIKQEFEVDVSPATILNLTGIDEDFEKENRRINYG